MSMWPVCARPFFLFPSGEPSPLMMTHHISWDMSTRMSLQCGEPFLEDCFTLLLVYQEKEARFSHKPNPRGAEGMCSFSSLTLVGQLRDVSRWLCWTSSLRIGLRWINSGSLKQRILSQDQDTRAWNFCFQPHILNVDRRRTWFHLATSSLTKKGQSC